jgi:bacterial/archaeal transporter family-2 protein
MSGVLVAAILCLIAGASVGMQSPMISEMGQRVGSFSSIVLASIVSIAGALLIIAAKGGERLGSWQELPPYSILPGLFGIVVLASLNYAIPRLGATTATLIFIVAQLGVGLAIDHFGLFGLPARPLNLTRIAAVGLMIAGAALATR